MSGGAGDAQIAALLPLPHFGERGASVTWTCPLELNGSTVTPASGTVTVYDGSGKLVETGSVVVSTHATYTWTPAASLILSDRWRVEWELVVSGTTHTFRNTAHLCRYVAYPSIGDADLYRRVPALDPTGSAPITTESEFQTPRREAWIMIQRWLLEQGRRPQLVVQAGDTREAEINGALMLIFGDMASRLDAAYLEQETKYRSLYLDALSSMRLVYDEDDDGDADLDSMAAMGTIWLMGR